MGIRPTPDYDAFREHVQGELGTLKEARAPRDAAEAARTSFVTSLRYAQATLNDPLVSKWTDTSAARDAFEIIRGVDPSMFSEGTDVDALKRLLAQMELLLPRSYHRLEDLRRPCLQHDR